VSVIELKDLWEQTLGLSVVHHLGDEGDDEGIAGPLNLRVRLKVKFRSIHLSSSSTPRLGNNLGGQRGSSEFFDVRLHQACTVSGLNASRF
jgi:hypothetical protein